MTFVFLFCWGWSSRLTWTEHLGRESSGRGYGCQRPFQPSRRHKGTITTPHPTQQESTQSPLPGTWEAQGTHEPNFPACRRVYLQRLWPARALELPLINLNELHREFRYWLLHLMQIHCICMMQKTEIFFWELFCSLWLLWILKGYYSVKENSKCSTFCLYF